MTHFFDIKIEEKFQYNGGVYKKISAKKAEKLEGNNIGGKYNFNSFELVWLLK